MKVFGIYLAYPPRTKLQSQGLGRYLAAFLGAASDREDIRVLVACPSWLRNELIELCRAEQVESSSFEIVSPAKEPTLLRGYEFLRKARIRSRRRVGKEGYVPRLARLHIAWIEQRLVGTRNIVPFALLSVYIAFLAVLAIPVFAVSIAARKANRARPAVRARARRWLRRGFGAPRPGRVALTTRIYDAMLAQEERLLLAKIKTLDHVHAWYSPTAFWPSFNEIDAPRLMCVPDLVPAEFPVGFARALDQRAVDVFDACRQAISTGEKFVTYSNHVKWTTLVDLLGVRPDDVYVVPHAVIDLGPWVKIAGSFDDEAVGRAYARSQLAVALGKSTNSAYTASFLNTSVNFIFYASQFRPSKNVVSLLRAYDYLLKERLIGQKLILTGNPLDDAEVRAFIADHGLDKHVLCLRDLTVTELAACYALADLAVNPSLSEGGCPFTLSEALSVGTPVVMARIPVTQEVVTVPELQQKMLFDPYSWQDMAERIHWALQNRAELLGAQTEVYRSLARRTWRDVVNDHLQVLSEIAGPASDEKISAS
ncbi:MAG: glycosyltransferase [Xanthobacteraceae bacterium]